MTEDARLKGGRLQLIGRLQLMEHVLLPDTFPTPHISRNRPQLPRSPPSYVHIFTKKYNGKVDVPRYSRSNRACCTRHWRQRRLGLYYLSGKHIPNGPYEAFTDDVVSNYLQKEPKFISRDASRRSLRTPSKG